MVRPASSEMSTRRVASATPRPPQALKKALPPPKVPVPRLSAGTMKPEPPSNLYSMIRVLLLLRSDRRQAGLGVPAIDRRSAKVKNFLRIEAMVFESPSVWPSACHEIDRRALVQNAACIESADRTWRIRTRLTAPG